MHVVAAQLQAPTTQSAQQRDELERLCFAPEKEIVVLLAEWAQTGKGILKVRGHHGWEADLRFASKSLSKEGSKDSPSCFKTDAESERKRSLRRSKGGAR